MIEFVVKERAALYGNSIITIYEPKEVSMSRQARERWEHLTSLDAYKEGSHARRFLIPRAQNPHGGFLHRNETSDNWDAWNLGWDHEDIEIRMG